MSGVAKAPVAFCEYVNPGKGFDWAHLYGSHSRKRDDIERAPSFGAVFRRLLDLVRQFADLQGRRFGELCAAELILIVDFPRHTLHLLRP